MSGLVDLVAAFVVFLAAMALYRMPLRVQMLWLPLLVLVAVVFALAVGLWLATLSAKYRDVSFAVAFLLQALMYASPVIYPASLVPEPLRFVYQLNPMTGVIEGFRWALLGTDTAPSGAFFMAVVVTLIGLVSGAHVFRRTERTIVDII